VSAPVRSGLSVRTVRVKPCERLALEYLEFRSAHWYIVQGWAEIVVAGVTTTALAGDRLAIPARMPHRMRNLGAFTLTVVQVQTREPLEESEIIRLIEAHGPA
jgi:mannose-6-phosphate isomerase-like protein (cupin superfamily)